MEEAMSMVAGLLCGIIGFFLGLLDEQYWVKYHRAEADRYRNLWLEGLDVRGNLVERIVGLETELSFYRRLPSLPAPSLPKKKKATKSRAKKRKS